MQARRGIAWLATAIWLVVGSFISAPPVAAADNALRNFPLINIASPSSIETQMLGEKPLKPPALHLPGMQPAPSVQLHQDGGDARLNLPLKTELNISIRYNREPGPVEPQRLPDNPLYMKYAMDYRVLSNFRVGLNSYLYRPAEEGFPFQRPVGNQLLGVGPEIKYDLGRWSFLLKSQVETGKPNRSEDLQNWFRVWYAF
jgi:hypothetical protein